MPNQATLERGSEQVFDKLFENRQHVTHQDLLQAIHAERQIEGLKIARWWWYGQPAIDQILATFQVDRQSAGQLVDRLVGAQNAGLQVSLEVCPMGLDQVESVAVQVKLQKNLQKAPAQA